MSLIESLQDDKKIRWICEDCGTQYISLMSIPPPSPKWSDGHICEPVMFDSRIELHRNLIFNITEKGV